MTVPAPQDIPSAQQSTAVLLCPTLEQLRRLLAEELPQAERGEVEAHVEQCRQCQLALESLTADSALRRDSQADFLAEPALLRLREEEGPEQRSRSAGSHFPASGNRGETPPLPPALAAWIDRVCDDFESAWRAARDSGSPPRLEDYVAQVSAGEMETSALLHELIQVDIYYRTSLGEEPHPDEYRARFPALDRVLLTEGHVRRVPGARFSIRGPHGGIALELPVVPGYELIEEVGRGGMGVVYKARHKALNRIVALKMILHTQHARPAERARFLAEAEAVAQLQHPHIVQIYEIGDRDGTPFFSLEFCSGGSLGRRLGDTPLPPREAAQLAETLARAMHAVHQVRVVHRDLKPDNILLSADGTPKITDFGLAKRLDQPGQTQPGVILGTPSYMAPEQAASRNAEIGPVTDVYALAAILYQMLTGRPPFKAATVWETRSQVLSVEPVPPRRLQPQVPADLETICLKGLHKDPRRRYGSAAELADDLGRFLRREPIRARPVPAWERALRWARRQPMAAALVGAVLLAVVAALACTSLYALYKDQQAVNLQRALERGRKIDQFRDRSLEAEAAGMKALGLGQTALAGRHFAEAASCYDQALATLEEEVDADAADLRRDFQERRQRLLQAQHEQNSNQEARARIERFLKDYYEVRFHDINFPGHAAGDDQPRLQELAQAALTRLNLVVPGSSEDVIQRLEGYRGQVEPEKFRQLVEGCYEVLLLWAESEAGNAARALRLLDTAGALARANELPPAQTFHLRRARYLAQTGDEAGAQAERARAAAVPPRSALDHSLAALDAYHAGQLARARVECEAVLGQQPDHFWAQYLLALYHLRARHWGEAKVGLLACLGRRSDFPWPHALLASTRVELGEFQEAEADFDQALRRLTDPPGRYVVLTNRSALWVRTQRWDQALADLRAAIALRPGSHQAYVNLAELHRRRQEWDAALAALDQAVARRPRDPALWYTRARMHLERGDPARARRDFEQTIALEPPGSRSERALSALVELGYLRHRARAYPAALADFDTALRLAPDYGPAHRQRAETLLALGRLEEAGQALDRCRDLGMRQFEIYKTRGLIHNKLRQYPAALADYTQALLLRPDPETLCLRGWVYLQLQSAALALADFEAALAPQPEAGDAIVGAVSALVPGPAHGDALCGRAQARARLGKLEQAVADAEQAVRQGPASPRVLFAAACIHARAAGQSGNATERDRGPLLSARHIDRALDLLEWALREVPAQDRATFWRQHVQGESSLAPIWAQSKMAQLARTYNP